MVASGGIQLVRDWLMNHLRSKLQQSTYYGEEGTGVCGILLAKEPLWEKTCESYSQIELCPLLMGMVGLVKKKAPRSFSTLIFNSGYFCNIEVVFNYLIFLSLCTVSTPILENRFSKSQRTKMRAKSLDTVSSLSYFKFCQTVYVQAINQVTVDILTFLIKLDNLIYLKFQQ